MRLDYADSIPSILRETVEERIDSVADLLPGWVEHLTIEYDINDEDLAACDADTSYRMMTVTLYPKFFADHDWRHTLLHEIAHSLLDSYTRFAYAVVQAFVEDETARAFIARQLELAEEAVAEDLAILLRKLDS